MGIIDKVETERSSVWLERLVRDQEVREFKSHRSEKEISYEVVSTGITALL